MNVSFKPDEFKFEARLDALILLPRRPHAPVIIERAFNLHRVTLVLESNAQALLIYFACAIARSGKMASMSGRRMLLGG